MKATISQIYNHANGNNQNLFGNVSNFDFMTGYSANASDFDFMFNKRFSTFFYFTDFSSDASITNIYNDFVRAIRGHLLINQKRYSELYRVHILAADAYDVVNNYDLHEEQSGTSSGSGSNVYGSRSENISKNGSDVFGAKSGTVSRNTSDVYGERTDESETTNGAQTTTTENDVSGFNSSSYVNDSKQKVSLGAKSDSGTSTKGEQTDTHTESETSSEASHTDTRTDTEIHSANSYTDTNTNSGTTSSTIHRYGNIGVQTPADVIGGHIELWDAFNFYEQIFSEIARAFLLVDDTAGSDSTGGVFSQSDIDTILTSIRALSNKIDTNDGNIMGELEDIRVDITDVHDNVHDAEQNILNAVDGVSFDDSAIRLQLNTMQLQASTLAANIISNDNTNTTNIRGDIANAETNITSEITGVVTNGY